MAIQKKLGISSIYVGLWNVFWSQLLNVIWFCGWSCDVCWLKIIFSRYCAANRDVATQFVLPFCLCHFVSARLTSGRILGLKCDAWCGVQCVLHARCIDAQISVIVRLFCAVCLIHIRVSKDRQCKNQR